MWEAISQALSDAIGKPFRAQNWVPVEGGCINRAYRLEGGSACYFVKVHAAQGLPMFEAEAAGLRLLGESGALRVPRPLCVGVAQRSAFLVMEHVPMGRLGGGAWERFGQQLAQMHRHIGRQHGWERDNTIGATPQPNAPSVSWLAFWQERRLGHQLRLARRRDASRVLLAKGERLLDGLGAFFHDHEPAPSLLHGDLWSGNCAADRDGRAVLYDPAVYFGDRETDLAMTELFGGFPERFYAAYGEAWPVDAGYRTRKTLYNLYHILNHDHLFGGGYALQAEHMVDRLLSEIK
ncbi:MAG: fructosamine kinase family protein [Betaproteobacteria bacterium]|nr:fructosamine kinase family protein [Betaproteobacteria bacterium]